MKSSPLPCGRLSALRRLGRMVKEMFRRSNGEGVLYPGTASGGRLHPRRPSPVRLATAAARNLPISAKTTRRIILKKGLGPNAGFIGLEEFDAIRVLVLPGQGLCSPAN